MRVFRVAVLIGLMAVPAAMTVSMTFSLPVSAQMTPGFKLGEERQMSEEEIERNKANEAAAKAARAKIPDAKPNADPWASVRTEPAAKTAKPKAAAK